MYRLATWTLAITLASVLFYMVWSGTFTDAGLSRPYKHVTVRQVDNGYVIELRTKDNPYFQERVSSSAGQAAAEVLAYLNGPPVRPQWEEQKRK